MGKQKNKAYDIQNLRYLSVCLYRARPSKEAEGKAPPLKVNLAGLEKAVKALPKADCEIIEKFWGLTGGPNHSKKTGLTKSNDVAYKNMLDDAVKALRKLFWIDYVSMYDENFDELVEIIIKRTNKNGVTQISDIEAIKYLIAFFILVWNGPKMNDNPLEDDPEFEGDATTDEYAVLKEMCAILDANPDNIFNLELLVSFFDNLYIQDKLVAKKCVGIEVAEECKSISEPQEVLEIRKTLGFQISHDCDITFSPNRIETVKTFDKIKAFKEERLFRYGAWDTTCALILGSTVNVGKFMAKISEICRSWSWIDKLEEFKTGEKRTIRISSGDRILDIYKIGELEFSDPNEIEFLYLSADLIVPKA